MVKITSQTRGYLTEQTFIVWCLKHNFEICRPVIEGNPGWDFLVDFDDAKGWQKVQVKTVCVNRHSEDVQYLQFHNGTVPKSGVFNVYQEGAYDLMAAVYKEKIWLFPFETLKGRSFTTHRVGGFEKKRENRVNWDEHEVE